MAGTHGEVRLSMTTVTALTAFAVLICLTKSIVAQCIYIICCCFLFFLRLLFFHFQKLRNYILLFCFLNWDNITGFNMISRTECVFGFCQFLKQTQILQKYRRKMSVQEWIISIYLTLHEYVTYDAIYWWFFNRSYIAVSLIDSQSIYVLFLLPHNLLLPNYILKCNLAHHKSERERERKRVCNCSIFFFV